MSLKNVNKLTKEDLVKYKYNQHLTVGDLKRWLASTNLPNDSLVMVQRVEDVYFEKHGWKVLPKECENGPTQYVPAWCCVKYNDEEDLMFIEMHY